MMLRLQFNDCVALSFCIRLVFFMWHESITAIFRMRYSISYFYFAR